ncbi:MAG: aldo/keto reductase [Bacteroidota bacterium]
MKNKDLNFSRIVAGVMSWGEWGSNFSPKECLRFIDACLDMGVTTFDHADIYGHYTTETLFGAATNGSSTLRQNMQLVSKCGIKLVTPNRPAYRIKSYDTSKAHILRSTEQSLRNLRTDYLDLLLIHRPSPIMNPHEIAEAFTSLLESGKVLQVGVSNFTATQFDNLDQLIPLACNQIEVSLLYRYPFVNGTLEQLVTKGRMAMAYSTMARGAFFEHPPHESVQRIKFVARRLETKYDATFDQIITAWILKHPANIYPIMGSTKIQRIQSAVKALSIEITREEWFMLWEAAVGDEVP